MIPMASFSGARQAPYRHRRDEDGYILLTLLLVVALMAITAAAVFSTISFEIRRDQEQELIHRGVQYSRAIRAYFKKFGRYPTRLEDLDNTSNLRFLRKRYKDPLNKNGDFRLLHYGEQGVTLAGGIAGGSIPGATPAGSPGGLNSPGGFSQPSAFGGNANSTFGANSGTSAALNAPAANPATGTDPSQASSSPSSNSQDSSSTKISSVGASDQSSAQQPVVGGPIVGVASVSKKDTIREFNHKKKYNEWQFVYDPATDRGGLITTPNQPALAAFGTQPGLGTPAGQMGQGTQPGTTGSTNGSSFGNSFGQPTGLSNNPNPPGGPPPAQPPSNPPQQQ